MDPNLLLFSTIVIWFVYDFAVFSHKLLCFTLNTLHVCIFIILPGSQCTFVLSHSNTLICEQSHSNTLICEQSAIPISVTSKQILYIVIGSKLLSVEFERISIWRHHHLLHCHRHHLNHHHHHHHGFRTHFTPCSLGLVRLLLSAFSPLLADHRGPHLAGHCPSSLSPGSYSKI